MAVIDERGRLFGLVNLIDAGVAVLVVAVAAAGVIGYAVFKTPAATEVSSIEPASQTAAPSMRLVLHGKNFVPYLTVRVQRTGDSEEAVRRANANPRAKIDRYALVTSTAARLFVESPTVAEVWLPEQMDPGSYDLVIYNETQQVFLKEAAFKITPPPAPPPPPAFPVATVRVFGTFTGIKRADAPRIIAGAKLGSTVSGESAEVISVGTPEPDLTSTLVPAQVDGAVRMPATLRIQCSFTGSDCRIDKSALGRGAAITLRDAKAAYSFTITDLVADGSTHATVRAAGLFLRLEGSDVARLAPGAKFTSGISGETGEVLSVGKAEPSLERIGEGDALVPAVVSGRVQLPATLRLRCVLTGTDCRMWSTPLARNASIRLTIGGRSYVFVIADLAADGAADKRREARVVVRWVLRPEMAALVKPGDVDISAPAGLKTIANPRGTPSPYAFPADQAHVISVGARRESTSMTQVAAESVEQQFNVQEPVVLTDATLTVPVTESPDGWVYKNQPVKAGRIMSFETTRYFARGIILSVTVDGEPPANPPNK